MYANYTKCMFPERFNKPKSSNSTSAEKRKHRSILRFSAQCKRMLHRSCGDFFDGSREVLCFEHVYKLAFPQTSDVVARYVHVLPRYFRTPLEKVFEAVGEEHKVKHRPVAKRGESFDKMFAFSRHNSCQRRRSRQIISDRCLPELSTPCSQASIRAAKTVRMRMSTVERVLLRDPEVKVIHLFRDPRGVVLSRSKSMESERMLKEGRELCRKMRQDIVEREALEQRFPHSFKVVRYEDLAGEPLGIATELFEFLQRPLPTRVQTWLRLSTQNTNITSERPMSTFRRNSKRTAHRWKTVGHVPRKELAKACAFVLKKLKYPA